MNNPVKKCIWCGSLVQSARSNKKFCSDRCKMQSFYSRQSNIIYPQTKPFTPTVKPLTEQKVLRYTSIDTGENALHYCNPVALNVQRFHPNTVDINSDCNKEDVSKTPSVKKQQETPYNWISSSLIDKVAEMVEHSTALVRFLYSGDYFSSFDIEKIKWVTTRLMTITEHLLSFSEQPHIGQADFERLQQALEKLMASPNFQNLPGQYPLTTFAGEMAGKLAALRTKHQRQKYFVLRLKPATKAGLIVRRYEMAALVTAAKLSELEFTQPGSLKR